MHITKHKKLDQNSGAKGVFPKQHKTSLYSTYIVVRATLTLHLFSRLQIPQKDLFHHNQ